MKESAYTAGILLFLFIFILLLASFLNVIPASFSSSIFAEIGGFHVPIIPLLISVVAVVFILFVMLVRMI